MASELFDTAFYRSRNPDVARSSWDPLDHFLILGAAERRDPHPFFDVAYYLENSPRVAASGQNPLVHYLTEGAPQGLDPHPLFDTSFYQTSNPDVAAAGMNALVHYVRHGIKERRSPSPLFDGTVCSGTCADAVACRLNRVLHYCDHGAAEGRSQRPLTREVLAGAFLHGEGLEVGALQNPLRLPPTARVQYVDRLPKEELYRQYPELRGLPLVDVDRIDDGETLSTFPAGSQGFLIANHFLEHCEDPLRTLASFARLLRPGGRLFLAVPDKRATFDRDRPVTPLEHVATDFTHGPQGSRRGHYEEWVHLVEPTFGRVHDPEAATRRVADLMESRYSIHFHVWTPADLAMLLRYARDQLRVPLELDVFVERSDEVVAILRRMATQAEADS